MPFQTIYTSGTGMLGMEKKLNTISNNLANMETTAYKKQRCNFEDLYYDNLRYPGSQDVTGEFAATGIAVGVGTRVTSIQSDFSEGSITETGRQLDIAIGGTGFFQCTDTFTGEIFYTRAGNFNVNANGILVMGSAMTGRPVEPVITIPDGTTHIQIDDGGMVWVAQNGDIQALMDIGQIELASFINPEGLLRVGENLYRQTESSGMPIVNNPGVNGTGILKAQHLEMSNVAPVIELIDMITSQRAYELNSKSTQTGDSILQTVISIKREYQSRNRKIAQFDSQSYDCGSVSYRKCLSAKLRYCSQSYSVTSC
ncbi:MAG: flagellar basal-body rod protein FlgG [Planctomycetaceae bacterium]|jgi:flagellar basal-body rod protein FlgG|nr:flagellar basal-body rod protein FlgG [Planctomycetaceae bacterium]